MPWRVEIAEDAERDLDDIRIHLEASYRSFGEAAKDARAHSFQRLYQIIDDGYRLADTPFIGTKRDEIRLGVRHVTFGKSTFWFTPDGAREVVQILGVFFGGQDHHRRMIARLAGSTTN